LSRPFQGDYIAYRENFGLKAILEQHGKEKLGFADRVNKYSRYMARDRRVLVVTNVATYMVAIEKNMVIFFPTPQIFLHPPNIRNIFPNFSQDFFFLTNSL
jgi:hypothetical protein